LPEPFSSEARFEAARDGVNISSFNTALKMGDFYL
jgi:hypothetical protein